MCLHCMHQFECHKHKNNVWDTQKMCFTVNANTLDFYAAFWWDNSSDVTASGTEAQHLPLVDELRTAVRWKKSETEKSFKIKKCLSSDWQKKLHSIRTEVLYAGDNLNVSNMKYTAYINNINYLFVWIFTWFYQYRPTLKDSLPRVWFDHMHS